MKKVLGIIAVLSLVLSIVSSVHAADDPTIPVYLKDKAKVAIKDFIDAAISVNCKFYLYDYEEDKLLKLDLVEVHGGVVKAKGGYLTCVDFSSGKDAYDVDFIVKDKGGKFTVESAVVHSVNGEERENHMDEAYDKKDAKAKGSKKGSSKGEDKDSKKGSSKVEHKGSHKDSAEDSKEEKKGSWR